MLRNWNKHENYREKVVFQTRGGISVAMIYTIFIFFFSNLNLDLCQTWKKLSKQDRYICMSLANNRGTIVLNIFIPTTFVIDQIWAGFINVHLLCHLKFGQINESAKSIIFIDGNWIRVKLCIFITSTLEFLVILTQSIIVYL